MEASVSSETIERANELYWGSDRSVNQIADELDLSKGALYALVRPLSADRGCPLCGAQTAYPNRTARERGRIDCPAGDWSGSLDEAVAARRAASSEAEEREEASYDVRVPAPPAPLASARWRTVAGGALLGAAVGLALVIWARRR